MNWGRPKNVTCCSPEPRVGLPVVGEPGRFRVPADWSVVTTRGGRSIFAIENPVWRVVRIAGGPGTWRVTVAPFRG
jgi:hypothetical protein